MSNTVGASMRLNDLAGQVSSPGANRLLCLCITTALIGSLTISGLTTGNATLNVPSDWVLSPGSVGSFTHSGNGHSGGGALNYALSNPADQGKVVIAWTYA
jgi:hypothetical protein